MTAPAAVAPLRPPRAAGRPLAVPDWLRVRLDNGLRAAVARRAGSPLVRLRLLAPAGADTEPAGGEGLASLTAPLLRVGTTSRDAARLAEAAEGLGSDLVTAADWETGSLSIDLLREDLDGALDLLLEVALRPAFPPAAVEAARARRIAQLRARAGQPNVLAVDLLCRALFGSHRYGASLLGTETALGRVGRDDVAAFHARRYGAGSTLIAVGDVEPEALLRRLEAIPLAALPPTAPAAAAAPVTPLPPPGRAVVAVDLPDSPVVEIRIGHPGVAHDHPDLAALQLLNAVLGAGPWSRLAHDLRRRHGFSYSIHSRFVARRAPGPFLVATCVSYRHAAAAARTVLDAMRRLQDEPVSETELSSARRWLTATTWATFETGADWVDRLSHLEAFGLADDCHRRALEQIEAAGADRLHALADRHLDPERAVVVAVGPLRRCRDELATLGALVEVNADALEEDFPDPVGAAPASPQGAVGHEPTKIEKGGD